MTIYTTKSSLLYAILRASLSSATDITPPTRCKLPATRTSLLPSPRAISTASWIDPFAWTFSGSKEGLSLSQASRRAFWVASAERSSGSMAFEVKSRSDQLLIQFHEARLTTLETTVGECHIGTEYHLFKPSAQLFQCLSRSRRTCIQQRRQQRFCRSSA